MKRLLTVASMLVLSAGVALAQSNSSGQNNNSQPSGIAAAESGGAPSHDSGAVGTGQMQGKDANQSNTSTMPDQKSSSTTTTTQSTASPSSTTSTDSSKSESNRRTADQPEGIKAAESGGAPTQDQGAVGYDQKSSQGPYRGQKVNNDNSSDQTPTSNSSSTDNGTAGPPNNTPSSTNPR